MWRDASQGSGAAPTVPAWFLQRPDGQPDTGRRSHVALPATGPLLESCRIPRHSSYSARPAAGGRPPTDQLFRNVSRSHSFLRRSSSMSFATGPRRVGSTDRLERWTGRAARCCTAACGAASAAASVAASTAGFGAAAGVGASAWRTDGRSVATTSANRGARRDMSISSSIGKGCRHYGIGRLTAKPQPDLQPPARSLRPACPEYPRLGSVAFEA